jgi:hypothetical protein
VGNQKFQIKVTLAKNEKKKKKRFHLQWEKMNLLLRYFFPFSFFSLIYIYL